ncbi:glycosyltransferase family 4 protein [Paenibacillus tarimensis]
MNGVNRLSAGINIIGYANAETGVGQSCRLAARAIQTTGIPFGIVNITAGNVSRTEDHSWQRHVIPKPIYRTNLFHVNADQIPVVQRLLGDGLQQGHYNIGCWHWELAEFPDVWQDRFQYVHEVWAPSQFVFEAVSRKAPVPVKLIPHGIEVARADHLNRDSFSLPKQPFLFLSMYDMLSFQERKNPGAAIDAFEKAFDPLDTSVGLVIKVSHSERSPHELAKVKERIRGRANIYLIDKVLDRSEVNGLLAAVDCVVSLHRSEGFGLPLAEAMFLGKPVIGTNWSANTTFMNENNSCAVKYKLVRIGADHGPYRSDQLWAEPDIEHAAYYMRKLVSEPEWRNMISRRGQETIRSRFSPSAAGEMIKRRLKELQLI